MAFTIQVFERKKEANIRKEFKVDRQVEKAGKTPQEQENMHQKMVNLKLQISHLSHWTTADQYT